MSLNAVHCIVDISQHYSDIVTSPRVKFVAAKSNKGNALKAQPLILHFFPSRQLYRKKVNTRYHSKYFVIRHFSLTWVLLSKLSLNF